MGIPNERPYFIFSWATNNCIYEERLEPKSPQVSNVTTYVFIYGLLNLLLLIRI